MTHRNILENAALLQRACDHDDSSTVVSWLPMFHDFGLIGCAFQPLFLGSSCVIMSRSRFFSVRCAGCKRLRATALPSGAPNFAFELCVRKISEKECEGLDLGSWRNAPCAAEPIRKSTLQRFTDRFSRYGFRASAHWPCYGLAESTLLTTGGPPGRGMVAYDFSASALQKGYARLAQPGDVDSQTLVALGTPAKAAKWRSFHQTKESGFPKEKSAKFGSVAQASPPDILANRKRPRAPSMRSSQIDRAVLSAHR